MQHVPIALRFANGVSSSLLLIVVLSFLPSTCSAKSQGCVNGATGARELICGFDFHRAVSLGSEDTSICVFESSSLLRRVRD